MPAVVALIGQGARSADGREGACGVVFENRGIQQGFSGESGVDASRDIVGHAGRARQRAEQASDLLQRVVDVGAERAVVGAVARPPCGREGAALR